jgi:1-deoxy-D-xylulose-5-phosphate synthase
MPYLWNMLLEKITSPEDVKTLSDTERLKLCGELRERIIAVVAKNEGHLGASLGTVELTVALHTVFTSPNDKIIWDVGHQAYGHKLLTGRNTAFDSNRQWGGLSGFPSRDESPHDSFGTGHAGTSLSAALGMALAARLQGNSNQHHVAVIGDASIASGMAFEALNHLGTTKANVLVVLNDNAQSIDSSVGALKVYFEKIKIKNTPSTNLFQALNIPYSGPINGHDLPLLLSKLSEMAALNGPRILHIVTTKGKGLAEAEKDQVRYHAPGKFDPLTGKINRAAKGNSPKYQEVVGKSLVALAETNKKLVAITPAMVTGSGLSEFFKRYPERAFDVGIAEQHALTLAAGFATADLQPFVVIYSTFLQRAYDQLIHDIALQNLPVVFCIDRAGLVGHDGPTHHGVFDISFLRSLPNMTLIAPSDAEQLRNFLYTLQETPQGPVAIRYPRGYTNQIDWEKPFKKVPWGKGRILKKGKSYALISVGPLKHNCQAALNQLKNATAWSHYDLTFIKPLDGALLHEVFQKHQQVVVVEDGARQGGAASAIQEWAQEQEYGIPIAALGIDDCFVPHGKTEILYDNQGLTPERLVERLDQIVFKKEG